MGRLPWMFLWEEVAAVDRMADDIRRQFAPDLKRPTVVDVPRSKRSGPAPQREHRAGDLVSGCAVGTVVLAIDARRGAVLLADRVEVVRIPKLREILRGRL